MKRVAKSAHDVPYRPSGPITTNDFVEVTDWCREYHKHGTMPQNADVRLHIAYYQLPQAMQWGTKRGANFARSQGLIAAALHCIIAAEAQGYGVEQDMGDIYNNVLGYSDIRLIEATGGLQEAVLWMCQASQQVVYGMHGKGSTRKSRFDPKRMGHCLGQAARRLISMCPPDDRARAIHDEMQIMCGDLM